MVPLATSTPGFKLGESTLKPSGSLFGNQPTSTATVTTTQPSVTKQSDTNASAAKPLFAGLSSAPTSAANQTKPLFGSLGANAAQGTEKKEEKKPSTLFGTLGTAAANESEKKEEKKSSLFGGIGTSATVSSTTDKKDDKLTTPAGQGGSASTAFGAIENKETKPSSLFGGTPSAQQTTPKSIFGGENLSKPLSFASTQPAKITETARKEESKDEQSTSITTEPKQPEVKTDGGESFIAVADSV
ncbi:unnamed protein product [Cylicostephanus goldi]|uniref:Uncharacterized protein n=1 Tax=Cylicostephanus goldi TaxID=71465 RepID=A0A3P6RSB0_CYLGO|nr:unnamed protein product [Cylicostephanus goldi]